MATMSSPASPSQMPVEAPAKRATRSSDDGAKARQPSVVSDPAEHREEQREDSRDCQDHEAARGGEAEDGHNGGRDPSPPGEFPCEERETPAAATAAGDAAAAAGTPCSQASRASNGPRRASGEALAAHLPLGGSWEQDLLNQDSFGFNLLDHQGNLSFDIHDAGKGGGGTPRSKGEGGRQAMDWTAAVPGDVVVSGATHNWIPPYYGDGGTYGGHAEMRDAYDDPDMFQYAFGDPAHNGGAAAPPAKGGRGASQASRRSKKRKQLERAEPLDGHHSPPPLPTVESAPAATLDFNPSHAGLPQSSTWGAYPYAPPLPGPHQPGADVHTAFLPPPPPPGGAPVSEVYVAAKGGPYGMPPYGYPAPDAAHSSGAPPPRRSKGSGKAKARNHRPPPAVAPVRRGPHAPAPQGLALLHLPNGARLTRAQAPGIGWPPEEDLALTELLTRHKAAHADWDRLARDHGRDRTARECHDRWTRYLKPGSRKGQWREEEDAVVLRAIFASGAARAAVDRGGSHDAAPPMLDPSHPPFTQWADLAPQLPGRTGKQIRDRWVNYLNPAINHLPFSREDDLRLWQGHKDLGKRWVEISVKVFGSSRSENHIKNRWYSAAFKKFVTKEFGQAAYLDAKAARGGVIGSATMGRSAGGGGRGHPAARMVHSHATRSQGV